MSKAKVDVRTYGLAFVLAVFGLVTDQWVVKRELGLLAALSRQRDQLTAEAASHRVRDEQLRAYAEALGGPDLEAALAQLAQRDPVSFLDTAVRKSGLSRHELATRQTGTTGHLHKSNFFLHVSGTYAEIARFISAMEQNPRLVVIDGFAMTPVLGGEDVEARINLSVYDPGARRETK